MDSGLRLWHLCHRRKRQYGRDIGLATISIHEAGPIADGNATPEANEKQAQDMPAGGKAPPDPSSTKSLEAQKLETVVNLEC